MRRSRECGQPLPRAGSDHDQTAPLAGDTPEPQVLEFPADRISKLREAMDKAGKIVSMLSVQDAECFLDGKYARSYASDDVPARKESGRVFVVVPAYLGMRRRVGLARRGKMENINP